MKKQKTLLVVVLIVAVVMVALYLAMGLMPEKEKKTSTDTTPMLTDMSDVTYVEFENEEAKVTFEKVDGGWTCKENAQLELVQGYVDEKIETLAKIEGTLVKDAKKADCGLEKPAYTLVIKDAKETVKLFVGCDENEKTYAMLDGKDEIYEISDKIVDIIGSKAEDFSIQDDDMSKYYITIDEETDETGVVDEATDDATSDIVTDESVDDTDVDAGAAEDTDTTEGTDTTEQ